jgi:hypothetical protein
VSDAPRFVSAPPSPPPCYPGPQVNLINHTGQRVAQLSTTDDLVTIDINNRRHTADSTRTINAILGRHFTWSQLRPVVRERPWAARPAHAVLLLFLASHWAEIRQNDGAAYHLTLSYALPLALHRGWREWAELHAADLVVAEQLVAVSSANLVAVQPDPHAMSRHRRLLRSHKETTVHEHDDLATYLDDWSHFNTVRYGRVVPANEYSALYGVLSMSHCRVRDFAHAGTLIGRTIVCWHKPGNVLFDVMATWNPDAARLRPGIYSGVYNLLDAHGRGARYSLCYGQFPYKNDIVGHSKRLTIFDLSHSSAARPEVALY